MTSYVVETSQKIISKLSITVNERTPLIASVVKVLLNIADYIAAIHILILFHSFYQLMRLILHRATTKPTCNE